MVAIVGGSKVSTKLTVLEALSEKCDQLVVGGGIANTFLKATGKNVGKSLCEDDLVPTAQALMKKMTARGATIPIAVDVVCGKKFDAAEPAVLKDAGAVADDDMIFDIGPKSAQELVDIIMKAGTVVWNGPVGVFEFDQFGEGTKAIAMAIANTKAFTLAGGGDTIAAIQKYDIYDKVSYISTAGGAFLEYPRRQGAARRGYSGTARQGDNFERAAIAMARLHAQCNAQPRSSPPSARPLPTRRC